MTKRHGGMMMQCSHYESVRRTETMTNWSLTGGTKIQSSRENFIKLIKLILPMICVFYNGIKSTCACTILTSLCRASQNGANWQTACGMCKTTTIFSIC